MYREQKTRHYWQNLQRHRVFASKVCIANRKTGITGKILQRHRFFGSKECVAWKQCAACDTGGLQVGFRWTSRDRLVSKNHLAVSRRKIKGAGKEVGEVGSHEDVHGYVSVAGGQNGR